MLSHMSLAFIIVSYQCIEQYFSFEKKEFSVIFVKVQRSLQYYFFLIDIRLRNTIYESAKRIIILEEGPSYYTYKTVIR